MSGRKLRGCVVLFAAQLVLSPSLVQASKSDEQRKDDVLAHHAGVVVTVGDVENELTLLSLQNRQQALSDAATLHGLAEGIYFRRRMEMLAEQMGVLDAPEVQARLQRLREEFLAEVVPRHYLGELELPDMNDAVLEYYAANQEKFTSSPRVHLAQIFLRAPDAQDRERRMPEARELLGKLEAGAEFGDLAAEYSDDGSRYMRGDLGMVRHNQLAPEIVEASTALETQGDTSGIVESRFGLHILKLVDRQEPEVAPLEVVEDRIRRQVVQDYRQARLQEWLDTVAPPDAVIEREDKYEQLRQRLMQSHLPPQ